MSMVMLPILILGLCLLAMTTYLTKTMVSQNKKDD